jgi:FkbM family methyltransferase
MRFNYFLGNSIDKLINLMPRAIRRKVKLHFFPVDMGSGMYKLKFGGFRPQVVIDVGAYRGEWASISKGVFPQAAIMMIEPQVSENRFLMRFCKKYPDCHYVNALVGAEEKQVLFYIAAGSNTQSRVLQGQTNDKTRGLEKSLVTLDSLIKGTIFQRPQLLKLDVQGYELEILKGAKSVLSSVEVIIMEVTVMPSFIPQAPLLYEAFDFMRGLQFRLYDICTLMYRPKDKVLYQMDAIFVKNTSRLGLKEKEWH